MTGPRATEVDVATRSAAAFSPTSDIKIGAEVEWLVYDEADPTAVVNAATTARVAAGRLPAGGTVTIEPGGQLELVTAPLPDPMRLIAVIQTDTAVLVERFTSHGLVLVPLGLDPARAPLRTLDHPRYEAMERYFADRSPAGLRMMNLTASFQLNIDFGADPATTWKTACAIAPVLAAAFANSPTTNGSTFSPVSHRQQVWAATDRSRTRPVGDAPADWLPYILEAQAMLHRRAAGIEPAETPATFGAWLHSLEPPSLGELDLHLTTLWPPLRPRGFLELRMIDAVPARGRTAAVAVVWALLTDHRAGAEAYEVCNSIDDPWQVATVDGLRDPAMQTAAAVLLDIASTSLGASSPQLARGCRVWRDHVQSDMAFNTIDDLVAAVEPAGLE